MSGWGAARKVNLKVQEGHRVDSDGIQWLLIKQFCPKSKQFEVWSDDWVHQIQPAGKYNLLQNNHDHHIRNNEFEYKIIINSCTALLRAEARKSLPSREALWKDSRLSSTPAIRGPLHTEKIIATGYEADDFFERETTVDHSMIMFKFQCLKIALSSRLNWSHTRTARRGSSSKWNSMVIPRSSNLSIKIDQIFFEILGYKVNKTNFQWKRKLLTIIGDVQGGWGGE